MSDEQIEELIERVRMLSRSSDGEIIIDKFIIGEDLKSGNLSIDLIKSPGSRPYGMRTTILLADRDSKFQISQKRRSMLDDLSYAMVLIELANI